jgi:riboflavin synthase
VFSGIIEEVGAIKEVSARGRFSLCEVSCPLIASGIKPGDSVSVNGVCLTAEKVSVGIFSASLSSQTKKETNLGSVKRGDYVNLESAIKMGEPVGGHLLTGHIDFQTKLKTLAEKGSSVILSFNIPSEFERYAVKRGSIGVDGISLTIAEIEKSEIKVFLVPFTIGKTNLAHRKPGDMLNIEVDITAKYVEKNLKGGDSRKRPKISGLL